MVEVISKAGLNDGFIPLEYGDLELPEFGEQESAIRALGLDMGELIDFAQGMEADEELKTMLGSHALKYVDDLVYEFVVDEVDDLGLDSDLRQRAENVIRSKNWEGVEVDSPEHFALRELVVKINRLKFQMINYWMENVIEQGTGLGEVAEAEYEYVMPAMAAADQIFLKMVTEKFPIDSTERRNRGFTNECAIVREVGGEVVEVPLHEAYPEETMEMVESYEFLLKELDRLLVTPHGSNPNMKMNKLLELKKEYYTVVLEALKCSDIEKWRVADSLLPGQIVSGNDLIHIHSIEVGYMKDRIVRAPGIGLRIPDLEANDAQNLSVQTKATMLESFRNPDGKYLQEHPAITKSVSLLERSNANIRHFLGTGFEIDLKPAGQILPNEFESRVAGGVDSSLDLGTVVARMPLARAGFAKVFGEKLAKEKLDPILNPDEAAGSDIASHELGHALLLVDGTAERLDESTLMNPYIEEWKATVAGLIGNYLEPYYKKQNIANYERLEKWLIGHVATACRYAQSRNHPYAAAYTRKSMMLMKVAEETGAIYKDESDTENPWKVSSDEVAILAFFHGVLDQFKVIADIYDAGGKEDLMDYLRENLTETPFLNYMFDKIVIPDPEKHTAAKVAELPDAVSREDEVDVIAEAGDTGAAAKVAAEVEENG